jgi:hypothetical protein
MLAKVFSLGKLLCSGACKCAGAVVCSGCNVPETNLTLSWTWTGYDWTGGGGGTEVCSGSIPITWNAGPSTWTGTFQDQTANPCTLYKLGGVVTVRCSGASIVMTFPDGCNFQMGSSSSCAAFHSSFTIPQNSQLYSGCGAGLGGQIDSTGVTWTLTS